VLWGSAAPDSIITNGNVAPPSIDADNDRDSLSYEDVRRARYDTVPLAAIARLIAGNNN